MNPWFRDGVISTAPAGPLGADISLNKSGNGIKIGN